MPKKKLVAYRLPVQLVQEIKRLTTARQRAAGRPRATSMSRTVEELLKAGLGTGPTGGTKEA